MVESSRNTQPLIFMLNKHYRFQWEPAQQCHVLLYPEGMIRLSETAAHILQRCLVSTTYTQVVAQLCKEFPDAPAEVIAADVREFIDEAHQQGWLVSDEQ